MSKFVMTNDRGSFVLDGKPWFLHGATYFGRRPGTCGADWMGENFAHNAAFFDRDFASMRELGLNTISFFVPAREFFDGLEPVQERFDQLHALLDKVGEFGLRAILYARRALGREAWCAEHGGDPDEGLWHPAVNPVAEQYSIDGYKAFRQPFADRPAILGWATSVGRFFRYGFTAPPVRAAWAEWLRERFDGDFSRARELLALGPGEGAWDAVLMPTEMEPYFNEDNSRSFEFALMQQVLCCRSSARIIEAVRPAAPNHLIVHDVEGCCFSGGHLTALVPELLAADVLWHECYNWEGLRSFHFGDGPPRWMKEPVAEKSAVNVICAAGYVQMLTRWCRRSGKPVIICHGVDIGEKRRGTYTEDDQRLLISRYNSFAVASGAHGINYWCWNDDELSKTYTRQFGVEFTVDTPKEKKDYSQAGETMGLVRYDGSQRPVCEDIRELSRRMEGQPADEPQRQVLVLFPCPMFQSLHRYRSNVAGFGILTSLARQAIKADVIMTSAGEELVTLDQLTPFRLVIVGASEYTRDHTEVPNLLARYVEGGGTLLLALAETDRLQDPYVKWRRAPALEKLSGAAGVLAREETPRLDGIASAHAAFDATATPSWEMEMDEPATFTRVEPVEGAEVLVRAGADPLLYRHRLGAGTVYVFTWNLDVLMFRGGEVDYPGGHWDWLWRGLAHELDIARDPDDPMARIVAEMDTQT